MRLVQWDRCRAAALVALAALALLLHPAPAHAINAGEMTALKDFYRSTGGPYWKHSEGWLTLDPCRASWWGVTCNERDHVVRIFLKNNNLTGSIPESFTNLVYLQHVDLTSNYIAGPLPSSIGNLASLESLTMIQNLITGPLPVGIGFLVNLKKIEMYDNWIFDPLPSTIGGLKSLEHLDFGFNQMPGTLPSTISQLSNLKYIDLTLNSIWGPVPDLSLMNQLEFADLSYNALNGTIPKSIARCTALTTLRLNGNDLEGALPASLASLRRLESLFVGDNKLNGTLDPAVLSKMASLQFLSAGNNRFSGTIDQSISLMPSLHTLALAGNTLQSPLPPFLQTQPKISVDLRNNNFSCPLPAWCSKSGNGRCEPCHDERDQILCCTYAAEGGGDTLSVCAIVECPDVVGLQLIAAVRIDDCAECVSNTHARVGGETGARQRKEATRRWAEYDRQRVYSGGEGSGQRSARVV